MKRLKVTFDRSARALRALQVPALLLMAALLPATGQAGGGPPFVEYPLAPGRFGFHITAGRGGFWFTQPAANQIAWFSPADGQLTEYPIPTPNSGPSVITACADGNLWFPEQTANQIGRCTPSGVITEFPVPTPNSRPFGIACQRAANGHLYILFTEADGNNIGLMDESPDGYQITEFPVPTPQSTPAFVVTGPDGALWFTEATASQMGRLDLVTGNFTEYLVPTLSILNGLTVGPDGRLYFTEYFFGNNIGSVNPPDGSITEYPIPTPNSGAFHGVDAADGNYYFTEQFGNKLGKLNLQTWQINEYSFPDGSGPSGLATMFRSADGSAPIAELAVLLPDRSVLAVAPIDGPQLLFTKAVSPDPVPVGQEITYTFTVTNNSPWPRDFYISDWLPAFLEPPLGQPDWHDPDIFLGGSMVSMNFSLAPGSSRSLLLRAVVQRPPGPVTNTAQLHERSSIIAETSVTSQVSP